MKEKRIAQSAFLSGRALLAMLVSTALACVMLGGTLLGFFRPDAPGKLSQRNLTFAERVAYQRAIEDAAVSPDSVALGHWT